MSPFSVLAALLDKHAPKPDPIRRCGLSVDEIRRASAIAHRKQSHGRGKLPRAVVQVMYAEFLAKGAAETAKTFSRSREALYAIFRSHRLNTRVTRKKAARRKYRKLWYTDTGEGYFRGPLSHGRKLLHVQKYEDRNGPVPAGHCVVFRDGDRSNLTLGNLLCLPRAEAMSYHRRLAEAKRA